LGRNQNLSVAFQRTALGTIRLGCGRHHVVLNLRLRRCYFTSMSIGPPVLLTAAVMRVAPGVGSTIWTA
jgi:hypothetical protein